MTSSLVSSKTDQEKRDFEIAQKLKPDLRKFVVGEQIKDAKKFQKDQIEHQKKVNEFVSLATSVIKRAEALSVTCFLVKRLWRENPPAVSMSWLMATGVTKQLMLEQKQDMWAFTRYLFNEYFSNYMEHKNDKAGYPDPMKEENLLFFWKKFNADLLLLVAADQRRVNAGNKGVVLADKDESK